mmetsp:Transcript_36397/g.83625  ORF Transcript_36397/g.83625 Transcript_36397/m.83625 type:complete len:326 (-) Transcript_36397:144-1121(-)
MPSCASAPLSNIPGQRASSAANATSCVTKIDSSMLVSMAAAAEGTELGWAIARKLMGVDDSAENKPIHNASARGVSVTKSAKKTMRQQSTAIDRIPASAARVLLSRSSHMRSRPKHKSNIHMPSSATLSTCTSCVMTFMPPGPTTIPPRRKPIMVGVLMLTAAVAPSAAAARSKKRSWINLRSSCRNETSLPLESTNESPSWPTRTTLLMSMPFPPPCPTALSLTTVKSWSSMTFLASNLLTAAPAALASDLPSLPESGSLSHRFPSTSSVMPSETSPKRLFSSTTRMGDLNATNCCPFQDVSNTMCPSAFGHGGVITRRRHRLA